MVAINNKKNTSANDTPTPSPVDPATGTKVVRDEHILTSLGMAPFRGGQRAYRHLSGIKGSGIIATLMSVYCAGLSIESIMVATPAAFSQISGADYTEAMRRSRRFLPKPYVADGSQLGRLSPIPNLQNAVLQKYFSWLPYWIKGKVQADYWTVWNEPGILALSVVVALMIQRFEGLIWRKKTTEQTRFEFIKANAQKKVAADPDAIALATYKAQQHNRQGAGGVVGTFMAVVILYGIEIAGFFGSFSGAGNFVINAIYGGLTICGFELFDRMAEESDDLQRVKK